MDEADRADVQLAVKLLEHPSLGASLAHVVGSPIERALALLPDAAIARISTVVERAIHASLRLALKTLSRPAAGDAHRPAPSNRLHKAASAVTGGAGGAFGLASLALELPLTTTLILRSIADVARSEGADLQDLQTQLECVEVLAFGGPSRRDDGAELGYFLAREAMTKAVADAAAHLARHGWQKEAAPAVLRLVIQIAQRYSVTVSEKVAAQAVPVVGAVGGAMINTVFMDHFQRMARGHFILRRLERKHGVEPVRQMYQQIRDGNGAASLQLAAH